MSTQETDTEQSPHLITPKQLAERWNLSVHTLENWRSAKKGPAWVKVGRAVRYRLATVEKFEQEPDGPKPKPSPEE